MTWQQEQGPERITAVSGLTVGQLAALLLRLPQDAPVAAVYDCGTAEGVIAGIERPADGRGALVLVVE